MDKTLKVINELVRDGVIEKYAIGGAIGLLFYAEPAATYDLDIFCYLSGQTGLLVSLGTLYATLSARGYVPEGEHIEIEGIPVQFLEPPSALVREALDNASNTEFGGVPTRVFQFEHLIAIMLETNRPKDKARLAQVLESAQPDQIKLKKILDRFNLNDKWARIVS